MVLWHRLFLWHRVFLWQTGCQELVDHPKVLTLLGRGCCSNLLSIKRSFSPKWSKLCIAAVTNTHMWLWPQHSSSRWFSFPPWLFLILSGLQKLPSPFSHYSFSLAAAPLELAILISWEILLQCNCPLMAFPL